MSDNVNRDSLEFAVTQTQADGHLNEVTLDVPNTDVLFFGRNTRLPAIAERSTELKNSVFLYYDRVDIAIKLLENEDGQDLVLDGATTTHDLIPQINAKYSVNLLPEDVVLETLNLTDNVVLTITETSISWFGSYNFTAAVPQTCLVDDVVQQSVLGNVVNVVEITQDVLRFQWSTFLRTRDNYIVSRRDTVDQEPIIVR